MKLLLFKRKIRFWPISNEGMPEFGKMFIHTQRIFSEDSRQQVPDEFRQLKECCKSKDEMTGTRVAMGDSVKDSRTLFQPYGMSRISRVERRKEHILHQTEQSCSKVISRRVWRAVGQPEM